jgi:hypothetical protein
MMSGESVSRSSAGPCNAVAALTMRLEQADRAERQRLLPTSEHGEVPS